MQFLNLTLNAHNVLGSVNSEVGLVGVQYTNFKAVLQSPQLLQ